MSVRYVFDLTLDTDHLSSVNRVDLCFFIRRVVANAQGKIQCSINEEDIERLESQLEKQLVKRKCANVNLSMKLYVPAVYVSNNFQFKSESYSDYVDELFFVVENSPVSEFILNKNKFKDKDFRNMGGETFLHIAARRGEWQIIKYFLEAGKLSVEDEDEFSDTPVFHVVRHDRLDLLCLILHAGLNVGFRNSSNVSLLHVAAESGALRIVKYLLRRNVDVNRRNNEGYTALHNALGQDDTVIIDIFLKHADVDLMVFDNEGNNYLHHSVRNNCIEAVFALLKSRPDLPSQKNSFGKTPLDMAFDLGNGFMIKLLQSDVPPLQCVCAVVIREQVLLNPKLTDKMPNLVKCCILPYKYQSDISSTQISLWYE